MLTSRLIDRPIRPLFPHGWRYETQIIALLLSADSENDSDVLAITGASAALALSSIPFTKTYAGVRVGLVGGEYIINPTFEQRKESRLDLIVAGTNDAIVMVEAGAKEVSEEEVVQAFEHAHAAIKEIVAAIDALAREAGKKKIEIAEEGDQPRLLPRGRGEGLPAARRGDADQGQARELRLGRPGPGGSRRQHPGRGDRAPHRREGRSSRS